MIIIEKPTNKRFKDRQGERFNFLIVMEYAGKKYGNHLWFCKCDCGNIKIFQINQLISNNTKSCGCQRKNLLSKIRTKHGFYGTPEYSSFLSAKGRCNNLNNKDYLNYGGRGIEFKFNSFEEFYHELGDKPEPKNLYSVERIDNLGHYEKENVKWETQKNQSRNRRNNLLLTYKLETKSLIEWAEIYNINQNTLSKRINKYKWCIDCAFNIKSCLKNRNKCNHKFN